MSSDLAPNVPTRVVELDRPRTMALTFDALHRIKELTGGLGLSEDKIFANAPALVWASLVDEDREDITADDVRRMLHVGNLNEVVGAITELSSARNAGGNGKGSPAPKKTEKKASR